MQPSFFASQAAFRRWLSAHHGKAHELLVGLNKVGVQRGGLTYKQALDEALCFGWIDGVRRRLDDARYSVRFTPRNARSIWSLVNVKRMKELLVLGRVHPAGRAAFTARTNLRTGVYSFEQRRAAELSEAHARTFRAHSEAWAFFSAQAPSYRRTAVFWVTSAKKEETRDRRLATLITDSAAARRLDVATKYAKKSAGI